MKIIGALGVGLSATFFVILNIAGLIIFAVQIWLALSGLEYLGYKGAVVSGIFVAASIILGSIGGFITSILGYVGLTKVYGFEWWQAALLMFPGVAFAIFNIFVAGSVSLISGLRRR